MFLIQLRVCRNGAPSFYCLKMTFCAFEDVKTLIVYENKIQQPEKMFMNLIRTFFGSTQKCLPERQVKEESVCPDVIEKTDDDKYESDVEALRTKFGDSFKSGVCIETTLKEMLELCPRERKRSDAYTGLVGHLKRNYGITLIIKSQKSKRV